MYATSSQVPLQHPVPQHAFKPPLTPDSLAKDSRGSLDSHPGYDSDPYNPSHYQNTNAQTDNIYQQQQFQQPQFAYQQQQYQQPFNLNDGTTQMGIQFGKSAFAAGHDYVDRNLARHLPLPIVKSLFNVSTAYVGAKLRLICFPWTHKRWMRTRNETFAPDGAPITAGYLSPRQDVNSPDLYIPFMSVVTYIILAAIYAGIHNRFHPEVLGGRASVSFAIALTELALIKLICYLLGVETGASAETGWSAGVSGSVELMSYCGYKFVSVLPPLAVKLFFPSWRFVYYAVFLYCLAAQGFFLLRSLKYVLLPDASSASAATLVSVGSSERRRRLQFLFIIACFQLVWMGVLVWI
ncbi:YIF1-domain-containing protein [Wallemia mellicola]|uniref:Protein YIF1 n=2 Tax=Wallemia mellicola TaxID=1708541 RepID=A0A4T0N4R5_9BASI|nr:YIF1-domain-containing protein [Wallemia mellicola CBS 633.66]TIB71128.1 hypothetical protein E3Q24_02491 [Wallemia mellicola]EIM21446.1 YIF1-domain-containing protein [Wallemia mellicola CBS 633.66]TIB74952.1 hypothetical protein E3Q23_02517 [Wallemia mellicola]TIB77792.1 YIF1-domain-containing protein [Wallemia mellicola]TIB86453.1 YIF1-domain-containing protein [Wallemia mellicola]|eukprot:XP_006958476.1 YIF1-domain-containing protein [Wallemia mellicola CBS 633.66]